MQCLTRLFLCSGCYIFSGPVSSQLRQHGSRCSITVFSPYCCERLGAKAHGGLAVCGVFMGNVVYARYVCGTLCRPAARDRQQSHPCHATYNEVSAISSVGLPPSSKSSPVPALVACAATASGVVRTKQLDTVIEALLTMRCWRCWGWREWRKWREERKGA